MFWLITYKGVHRTSNGTFARNVVETVWLRFKMFQPVEKWIVNWTDKNENWTDKNETQDAKCDKNDKLDCYQTG